MLNSLSVLIGWRVDRHVLLGDFVKGIACRAGDSCGVQSGYAYWQS